MTSKRTWPFQLYARVFSRPLFDKFNRVLLQFALRGLGILNFESPRQSGERAFVEAFFANPRPDGHTVVDVGAHVGDYTSLVLNAEPTARIYAFEPNPAAFAALATRFPDFDVRCLPLAVGATEGIVDLNDYADQPGSSHATLITDVFDRIHTSASRSLPVKMIDLSSFLQSEKVKHVSLLKIDVEGSELGVLRGLQTFLNNPEHFVEVIQLEFNEMHVYSRTFVEDLHEILHQYRVYRLLPRGRRMDITHERPLFREIFAYQNLVFLRSGQEND